MSRRLSDHYVYRLVPLRPSFHENTNVEEKAMETAYSPLGTLQQVPAPTNPPDDPADTAGPSRRAASD